MTRIKKQMTRLEKVDTSGLVKGMKIHDNETFIVICPTVEGRIKLINNS